MNASTAIGLHVGDREVFVARYQDGRVATTAAPALMALVPAEALAGTQWLGKGARYSGEVMLFGAAVGAASALAQVREAVVSCGRLDVHRPVAEFGLTRILEEALGPAKSTSQLCVAAVPGPAVGPSRDALFHAMVIQDVVRKLGYSVTGLEEGRAVVLAEKEDAEVNLLGLSCDDRLIQGCLSCRGIVGVNFSLEPGAGWVDDQVSRALEVSLDEAREVRARCASLMVPQSRAEEAVLVYSRRFAQRMWHQIANVLEDQGTPFFGKAVDAVWAGPWRVPDDFAGLLLRESKETGFPVPLRSVRYSRAAGVTAVARGCLEMARMIDGDELNDELRGGA
jgi:hypothetical protein